MVGHTPLSRYFVLLLLAALVDCGGDPVAAPGMPQPPATPVPTTFEAVSANAVSGTVGAAVAQPLRVRVTDANGQGVSGIPVDFRVTLGGGTISVTVASTAVGGGGSAFTVIDSTDASGEASGNWTLGPTAGLQRATATVVNLGTVTFDATAAPDVPSESEFSNASAFIGIVDSVADGPVEVLVEDQFGNAISGVTVSWTAVSGGAVSAPSSMTDAQGIAAVSVTLGSTYGLYLYAASAAGLDPDTIGIVAVEGTTDPTGDEVNTGDAVYNSHDVTFFGGANFDSLLVFYFRFADSVVQPIASGMQPARAVVGWFDMDLDQDTATGYFPLVTCIGGDTIPVGSDAFVDFNPNSGLLANFTNPPAGAVVVARVDSLSGVDRCNSGFFGQLLAPVPLYRANTATLGIPQGFLEDDAILDFTSFVGRFSSTSSAQLLTDIVPDSQPHTFDLSVVAALRAARVPTVGIDLRHLPARLQAAVQHVRAALTRPSLWRRTAR